MIVRFSGREHSGDIWEKLLEGRVVVVVVVSIRRAPRHGPQLDPGARSPQPVTPRCSPELATTYMAGLKRSKDVAVMVWNLVIVVLAVVLCWLGGRLADVERQRYAMQVGLCGGGATAKPALVDCLRSAQPRTSWWWNLYYGLPE